MTQTNLIVPNRQYFHPFTRDVEHVFRARMTRDMDFAPAQDEHLNIKSKTSLTYRDIVQYYYDQVKITGDVNVPRDLGSLKYVFNKGISLDLVLFAIDVLALNYWDGDIRPEFPPLLIEMTGVLNEASVRLGQVKAIVGDSLGQRTKEPIDILAQL
jgi:hypothetical protein